MIEITNAGLTLLQDNGRENYSNIGVPISGAWDRERYAQASMLISGDPYSCPSVFELLAGTFSFRTTKKITLAIVGAAKISIGSTSGAIGTVFTLEAGQEITIQHLEQGPVYVVIYGLQVETTLGSCSTDTFSKLGPAQVAVGIQYPVNEIAHIRPKIGKFIKPEKKKGLNQIFRIIRHDHSSIPERITEMHWIVSQNSRSGVKLTQKKSDKNAEIDFSLSSTQPSHPVSPGTIQIPPDQSAIILGPDSGTIGGYPTLGAIIQSDLGRLARLTKGAVIQFEPVSIESAISLNDIWWKNTLSSVVDFS